MLLCVLRLILKQVDRDPPSRPQHARFDSPDPLPSLLPSRWCVSMFLLILYRQCFLVVRVTGISRVENDYTFQGIPQVLKSTPSADNPVVTLVLDLS